MACECPNTLPSLFTELLDQRQLPGDSSPKIFTSGPAERFSKWGGAQWRNEPKYWGGGAQSLRGSVATEGQGRRSIFREGGGQKLEKFKIFLRKICNI